MSGVHCAENIDEASGKKERKKAEEITSRSTDKNKRAAGQASYVTHKKERKATQEIVSHMEYQRLDQAELLLKFDHKF